MDNIAIPLTEQNVKKEATITLHSPKNPTPTQTIFLSNIDQTVAFPVETVFFYDSPFSSPESSLRFNFDVIEIVKRTVSEVLLVPYYFLAGRLNFNAQLDRLELVCNNDGVLFTGATCDCTLKEIGNLSSPNTSFLNLITRIDGFKDIEKTPIFTVQVTSFKCGGFCIGFVSNHSILDGASASNMLQHLASICRGDKENNFELHVDRSIIKARNPPQIMFEHPEYTKIQQQNSITTTNATTTTTTFTSPTQQHTTPQTAPKVTEHHNFEMLRFSPEMIKSLKAKSMAKCSTFEAVVGHIWRARTKAVFTNPEDTTSVLFAVDIRSRMNPPLPSGFIGNGVITALASARVHELVNSPLTWSIMRVKEANERVNDQYVRSIVDWLEVHKGVPSTMNGGFFVSAWWKLPFHKVDFGFGQPLYGGPVVSTMDEFVLLLSDGSKERECGINVWIALEKEKMKKFMCCVHEF